MKRIVWIVVVVAVLVGAGLYALRSFGENEIDRQLDVAQAQAEARGWTLTWGTRTAEGFPMANRVVLSDVALVSKGGVLVKAGEIVIARDAAKEALAVRLPAEMSVTVPIGGLARQRTPFLPERIEVMVTTEDAVVRAGPDDGGEATAILTAGVLRMGVDQDDFPIKLALDVADIALETDAIETGRRFRLKSGSFGVDFRDTSGGNASIIDSRYSDLSIGATVRAKSMEEMLSGLQSLTEDVLDGAFQSAAHSVTVSFLQPGAPAGRPTNLTWEAGPQTGIFAVAKGTVSYSAEDRDIRATLDLPTPAGTTSLTAQALFYQRQFDLPYLSTGTTARPAALRVAIEDFRPDEAAWAMVDPNNRLNREPADLLFDATGTLRLIAGAGGLPVEFSSISLAALRIAALGAVVEAEGDVDILQPINLPLGEVKVKLSGAGALIDTLAAAGLVNADQERTADAILQVYARPDESAERHETEFAFTNDGVLINGRTIDGRTPGERAGDALDPTRRGGDTDADGDAPSAGDGTSDRGTPPADGADGTGVPAGDDTSAPADADGAVDRSGAPEDEDAPAPAATDDSAGDGAAIRGSGAPEPASGDRTSGEESGSGPGPTPPASDADAADGSPASGARAGDSARPAGDGGDPAAAPDAPADDDRPADDARPADGATE